MKLIDDFYHIVDTDCGGEQLKCRVAFNTEHYIYQAHFPGNPITPGVCLMQMVSEMLERQYRKRLLLQTVVNIKFRKPMPPTAEPTFVFTKVDFDEDRLSVGVSIEENESQFARMSLQYQVVKE